MAAEDASSQALSEALGSSLTVVRWMMVLLVGALVASCVFTVNPNEVAVVLFFGKPRGDGSERILHQGLHWAFPYPIDEIVRIPVGESRSVRSSVAWYATTPEMEAAGQTPTPVPSLAPGTDGAVITADGNLLHVRATLKYRVTDPAAYVFNFYDATNLLANMLNNAVYWAGARFKAEDALYKEPAKFNEAVRLRVSELIAKANLGVTLEPLQVDVAAPLYVKSSFEAVQQAEQDWSRLSKDAQGYRDETVRKAQGEAAAVRSAGVVSSNALVQAVWSEARYFTNQIASYEHDPQLFVARKRVELASALTNAGDRFFFPNRADGAPRELRITLNREPQEPKKPEAPTSR